MNALEKWWYEKVCGPWTENKNWSRKFLLVWSTVYLAMGADLFGHPISDSTLTYAGIVIPTWVGVQGGIDFYKYRRERKAMAALMSELLKQGKENEDG